MTISDIMTSLPLLASLICIVQYTSAEDSIGGGVEGVSPLPVANKTRQLAFGVARNSSVNFTDAGRLQLPQDVANAYGFYRHDTDDFVSSSSGISLYLMYVCVGVQPMSTVDIQQRGGYPKIGYTWQSNNHGGVVYGCRSGISRLTKGVVVGLDLQGGNIFSDSLLPTSFSVFSITDAMTSAAGAMFISSSLGGPYNTQGAIPFGCQNTIFVNPTPPEAVFNAAAYSYTCLTGGYYLVSLSVGLNSGQSARIQLTDLNTHSFELIHNTKEANGLITLSRSVLLNCSAGTILQLFLVDGEISSGPSETVCDQNLVSWTVVRYAPVAKAAAWAIYMNHVPQWPAGNDSHVLSFNVVGISDGAEYKDGVVKVSYSGTYMVYLSAATLPGQPINLVVRRNKDVVFGLVASVTAADGSDMMEHCIIIQLAKNDTLTVVAVNGTSVYSDEGLQVGFWGFLIYGV